MSPARSRPAPGLLDPCHWAATAPQFTIAAGKTTGGVKITLARGAIVSIHVDDPHQLLAPPTGVMAQDLHLFVVTAKGHHYEALIVASAKNGRDHSITVPFGAPLTVKALSSNLAVSDDTGNPVDSHGKSIVVPASLNPAALHYTVTGNKSGGKQ